jgi:type II secretory ATPase GspE/PulE/Tfp pilus assembly ATPase PilB-like protein
MANVSVLEQLKRKELTTDAALKILVGDDLEINPHALDTKIKDLFMESIRRLPKDEVLPPVIPLLLWGGCYYLGSPLTPSDAEISLLRRILQVSKVQVIPVSERSYRNWFRWNNLPQGFTGMDALQQGLVLGVDSHEDITDAVENRMLFATTQQERISRLITEALSLRASDIHLEPTRAGLSVRYRIDGILRPVTTLPVELSRKVVMAIKVMCDMNIAESRKPQDGRINEQFLSFDNQLAAIRVSTMPTLVVGSTEMSEKVVMRLLPMNNTFQKVEDLGLSDQLSKVFKRWIRQPQGLIIITGPTGSGKTSTLYTSLITLATGDKNIATIEDPVECYIPNVVQSQVNKASGLTFAEGLRSLLRQDPDIVMVGEIRDSETAETALRAALTGHLVLTTLHTNDALGALPRLKALGMDTGLCSEALVGIACQRLVRKVCPYCAVEHTPSEEEMQMLGLDPRDRHQHKWRKGKGCAKCFNSGYLGREGVFELIDADDTVKMAIYRNELDRLRVHLNRFNTLSFRESVLGKIISGVTTLEEVMRVLPDDALQLKLEIPTQLPKLYDDVIVAELAGEVNAGNSVYNQVLNPPPQPAPSQAVNYTGSQNILPPSQLQPIIQNLHIHADFIDMKAKETVNNSQVVINPPSEPLYTPEEEYEDLNQDLLASTEPDFTPTPEAGYEDLNQDLLASTEPDFIPTPEEPSYAPHALEQSLTTPDILDPTLVPEESIAENTPVADLEPDFAPPVLDTVPQDLPVFLSPPIEQEEEVEPDFPIPNQATTGETTEPQEEDEFDYELLDDLYSPPTVIDEANPAVPEPPELTVDMLPTIHYNLPQTPDELQEPAEVEQEAGYPTHLRIITPKVDEENTQCFMAGNASATEEFFNEIREASASLNLPNAPASDQEATILGVDNSLATTEPQASEHEVWFTNSGSPSQPIAPFDTRSTVITDNEVEPDASSPPDVMPYAEPHQEPVPVTEKALTANEELVPPTVINLIPLEEQFVPREAIAETAPALGDDMPAVNLQTTVDASPNYIPTDEYPIDRTDKGIGQFPVKISTETTVTPEPLAEINWLSPSQAQVVIEEQAVIEANTAPFHHTPVNPSQTEALPEFTEVRVPAPKPEVQDITKSEAFNDAVFELQSHSLQTLIRVKKLMFAVCTGNWPNEQHDLESITVSYLIKKILQKYKSLQSVRISIDNFVKNLNKVVVYRQVGDLILQSLQPLYQDEEQGGNETSTQIIFHNKG